MRRLIGTRLESAHRIGPVRGVLRLPNFFRASHGSGWVLIGDAGHHKDPLAARGISDAFRDAQSVSEAITVGLEQGTLHKTLAEHEQRRDDASWRVTELNAALSTMSGTPEDTQRTWAELAAADAAAASTSGSRTSGRFPSRDCKFNGVTRTKGTPG